MKHEQPVREQLCGLLGMARRAGRLTTGYDAVAALVASGAVILVLTAADLSEKTEKELRFAAQDKRAEIQKIPLTKEEIGHSLGLKKPVGVLALEDKGFAAAVKKRLCGHDFEEECTV